MTILAAIGEPVDYIQGGIYIEITSCTTYTEIVYIPRHIVVDELDKQPKHSADVDNI